MMDVDKVLIVVSGAAVCKGNNHGGVAPKLQSGDWDPDGSGPFAKGRHDHLPEWTADRRFVFGLGPGQSNPL